MRKSISGLTKYLTAATVAVSPLVANLGCTPRVSQETKVMRSQDPDLFETYKNIDMKNLSQYEKTYLDKMHSTYGKDDISLKNLECEIDTYEAKNYRTFIGKDKFNDRDLIFILRTRKTLAGSELH